MEYKEYQDVTLKTMIDNGFLMPKSEIFLSIDERVTGIINSNGELEINIDGARKIFPFPSGAARAFTKTSVNGWKYWKINFQNEYIEIAELKKKYLNSKQ